MIEEFNDIINEKRIISPDFSLERIDPNDDDISDLNLTESYGFHQIIDRTL